MDGILGESHDITERENKTTRGHHFLQLLSQLSSNRRLKYGGGHPQRRPRDPMEQGWCWKQVAGRDHLWCHPSGTWQQSSTDWHLLSPMQPPCPLLPIRALTSLLAATRTPLQGEAVPLHEPEHKPHRLTVPAPCWSSATSDLMVMKWGLATKWNWKQWSFMPWNKLLIVGNPCCKQSNLRPDRHYN